jgi:4-amino-4-deoxychorismate lyase
VSYDASGASCSVFPYVRRKISRLVLVAADDLSYEHKYEDRSRLVAYASGLAPYEEALFTVRGYVTDTTFSNIVFFDGKDYFTPSTYLLKGTMRQRLVDSGKVRELAVRADLIKEFQSAHLINAMNDVGDIQFQTSEFV